MRITKDKLYLIQPTTTTSDGILWCEILVESFFPEYIFEGLRPEDMPGEEIIVEMASDDFRNEILNRGFF